MNARITIGQTSFSVTYNLETFERLARTVSDCEASIDIQAIANCDSFTILEHCLILRFIEVYGIGYLSALCEFVNFNLPVHSQILEVAQAFKDAARKIAA